MSQSGEEANELGAKLYISCKVGDFPNVMDLLDEIDELQDNEREAVLDYTDKKGNTHLHAIVRSQEMVDELYETNTEDKKFAVYRLLDLALNPNDTNSDNKTVFDVCPPEFLKTLQDYAEKKRKAKFRGGSLVAEGATIKSMRAAATAILAVGRFKRLGSSERKFSKSEAVQAEERRSSVENVVMEV